jgi:hypothetical protein
VDFYWFFGTAIPFLFPPEILKRNTLMLTDGDQKEYGAFTDSLQMHYPNSKHCLCSWHLLDRGLKPTGIFSKASLLGPKATIYFQAMINWVKTWFYTLETIQEYNDSYQKLYYWLSSDEVKSLVGPSIINGFIDFIKVSLDPHKFHWLNPNFLYTHSLDCKTTQLLEAENNVLKMVLGDPGPIKVLILLQRAWIHKTNADGPIRIKGLHMPWIKNAQNI